MSDTDTKKGKCYSKVNRGQRKASDLYETPYSMTRQLLDVWFPFTKTVDKQIFEPACGNGAIVKVIKEYGYDVISSDILWGDEYDFLKETKKFGCIITNPPYSIANEFICHAKRIAVTVAMLLPLNYLQGVTRYREGLYTNLEFVYVFTRMSRLDIPFFTPLREDGKYETGMQAYAWYIWNYRFEGSPSIHWINNNEYVLRKSDKGVNDES